MIRRAIIMPLRAIDRLRNGFLFSRKKVKCGEGVRINGRPDVRGHGVLIIGPGVRINSGSAYNPIGGDRSVCFTLRGGKITIGSQSGLSNCTIVSDTEVEIGSHVNIGGSVKIYDTDFHNLDPTARRDERPGRYYGASRPVRIGNNAFIGAHSIILKGVEIGENSIVGAGSVVTKSIPPNQVWAGNPAHHIRNL